MTELEVEEYYRSWEKLGQVYEGGDYIPIFKNSVALITDSISFLGEYLPTGKPVFQFINNIDTFNNFGKSIISSYYKSHNVNEMEHQFDRVIINNDDFLKNERLQKRNLVIMDEEKSSSKIFKYIKNTIYQ